MDVCIISHRSQHALSVMRFTTAVAAVLLSGAPSLVRAQAPKPIADVDSFVTRVMRTFTVPGVSLAVVKDGRMVYAKGYGVRKLGDAATVDTKTLFGIASNTKIFTATALALLVEEGKIEWDAPVIRYVPWFAMYDPFVTRELTVRDLLVHRSGLGLGAGDLLWWPPSTYDRKEIARRLRFIKPATSFRSAYAYDNVLYTVAGEVIEAVSGMPWEDFVSTRILKKIGMAASNVRHSDAAAGGNIAATHASIEGVVRRIAPFSSDNTNPAGGINSNADEMAKWLIVQLDSGRMADGTRLFAPSTTRQLWGVVTPLPSVTPPPQLAPLASGLAGYALGMGVREFRGEKLLTHTGGLPGYVSRVAMIPGRRLGVVVLTNQESTYAFDAIVHHILDAYLGAAPFDWLAASKWSADEDAKEVAESERQTALSRDTASRPSLPLAKYTGAYADAWYGAVGIALENGKLVLRFSHSPSLVGDLEHFQYNSFIARWRDRELRADAFVTFDLNPNGTIERVRMQAVSPATDFSFDFQDLELRPVRK